ncbi:hypothetical protein OG897_13520 [Streptomyces sp. NBC_00237]|uniref:hypothetical protein n=1 Tax=Streptomyces sp. NBC_00237 TaxID=2975687 RepID=UPI00225518B1|nr:hypothetical protein [Streptomyces sp. NBC_00237]MCX5202463.1 hypothetical protein [Streptomyces sp. NBC_00237]
MPNNERPDWNPNHPEWMRDHLPAAPSTNTSPTAGITQCRCGGEGCDACDNTGVIYP